MEDRVCTFLIQFLFRLFHFWVRYGEGINLKIDANLIANTRTVPEEVCSRPYERCKEQDLSVHHLPDEVVDKENQGGDEAGVQLGHLALAHVSNNQPICNLAADDAEEQAEEERMGGEDVGGGGDGEAGHDEQEEGEQGRVDTGARNSSPLLLHAGHTRRKGVAHVVGCDHDASCKIDCLESEAKRNTRHRGVPNVDVKESLGSSDQHDRHHYKLALGYVDPTELKSACGVGSPVGCVE